MGPGVTRANTVLVWQVGQIGRRMGMMLSPLVSGGSVTELSSPVDTEGGGDGPSVEPFAIPPLVNIAHFRKVNTTLMSQFCASDGASLPKGRRHRANAHCSELGIADWRLSNVPAGESIEG